MSIVLSGTDTFNAVEKNLSRILRAKLVVN